MVEVTGIYKSYRNREILKGASFTAEPGKCTGIVGVNGCGKTTLLSIVAGAAKADRGTVRHTEKTAYVPQENPLMEELSVKDNLLLWHRGNKKETEKDLEQGTAAMLGLSQYSLMAAGKLSGGMKKRLSIACALADQARILIMDEPGAALDLVCKQIISDYLKQYMKQGGTVILTSHEMEELKLCEVIYIMKNGILTPMPCSFPVEQLVEKL